MVQQVARLGAETVPLSARPSTGRLLGCGLIAGPLFVLVTAIEIVTRSGFDLRRNGISQLSLGDRGWIQVLNFIVAGLLTIAFAVGVRRVLRPGIGATAAPVLIVGYGLGLIATGLFLVDPGVGFPPGTPDSVPELSWHGLVHAFAPPASFLLLVGAGGVFAWRCAVRREFLIAGYCILTGLMAVGLICWPGGGGSVRSAVAVVLTSVWMSVIAWRLIRGNDRRAAPSRT